MFNAFPSIVISFSHCLIYYFQDGVTAQEAVVAGYEVQKETVVIRYQKEVECIVLEVGLDTSRATHGNARKVHKNPASNNAKCLMEITSRLVVFHLM